VLFERWRHAENAALVDIGWHAPLDRLADARMPFVQRGAKLLQDWLREGVRLGNVRINSRIFRRHQLRGIWDF
jgi:hypothetical protein